MIMDAIERLENWKSGSKARCVTISIDDGYGASCWEVELMHEHGKTVASEVQFFEGNKPVWCPSVGLIDGDWPGLAATIHKAIDTFEAGHWLDAKYLPN